MAHEQWTAHCILPYHIFQHPFSVVALAYFCLFKCIPVLWIRCPVSNFNARFREGITAVYIEFQSAYPFVGRTWVPLPRKRACLPSWTQGRGEQHFPCGRGDPTWTTGKKTCTLYSVLDAVLSRHFMSWLVGYAPPPRIIKRQSHFRPF